MRRAFADPADVAGTPAVSTGRRRLRLGAREGHVNARLAAALAAEVTRLRRIADPHDRAGEVTELFAGLDTYLDQVSAVRAEALVELHEQGWTYGGLAELTGLTRSRVGRICQLGRQG